MTSEQDLQYLRQAAENTPLKLSTERYRDKDELAFLLSRLPMATPRPLKVILAGAGFSGISFARAVDVGQLKNVQLQIYEKNSGIGGTWFENRYPGCACDIPIHNYQLSWAPYPYFNRYYAGSEEILQYIESVADQHGLRKYVKTSHMVTGATWNETKQKWSVTVQKTNGKEMVKSRRDRNDDLIGDPFVEECDIFINATGFLNDWKWPAIPGRETFKGQFLHTAAYDKSVSLSGKKVAVIGNGSSGVQVIASTVDDVSQMTAYMRSPTWITPSFALTYAPESPDLAFTEEVKEQWATDVDAYLQYRKVVEAEINSHFKVYLKDSEDQKLARNIAAAQLRAKLVNKPDLAEKLIPDFAVGCRRLTPGNGFLEALASNKCESVWGEIDSFTPCGIRSADGTEREFDIIICATGFDISFTPRFPVVGLQGRSLQDEWAKRPEAYLSIFGAGMPNYFTMLGPSSPIGHGSLVTIIERITHYIANVIQKLQTQNYSSVVVKPEVAHAYTEHCLAWLEQSSWNTNCVSTYKNGKRDGELVSLHPGSRLHFFKLLQVSRDEDFEWKSLCADPNLRFAWFGNGFVSEEVEMSDHFDPTYWMLPVPTKDHIRRVGKLTNGSAVTNGVSRDLGKDAKINNHAATEKHMDVEVVAEEMVD